LNSEKTVEYASFLGSRFGAIEMVFSLLGSLKSKFYGPFSRVKEGVKGFMKEGFNLAGDAIIRGCLQFPKPFQDVWSGTKYSFKSAQELSNITDSVGKEVARLESKNLIYSKGREEIEPPREQPRPMLEGLKTLKEEFAKAECSISKEKESFIEQLAKALPENADPFLQSEDGTAIDIFWEDRLAVSITQSCAVSIYDYQAPKDTAFEFYKTLDPKAIEAVVRRAHSIDVSKCKLEEPKQ